MPGIDGHFDFAVWQPRQQVGPFTVDAARVDHPVEAYAVRVSENITSGGAAGLLRRHRSLCRAGRPGPGCGPAAGGAAFLEGPDNPRGLHLTGRQAAEAGAAAGVGAVLLTHIPPWHDPDQVLAEATPHFDGPVSLAVTGASLAK